MQLLVDTNILIRYLDVEDVLHRQTSSALTQLRPVGHDLVIAPQCIYEFWAVSTRPVDKNGLGLKPSSAAVAIKNFAAALSRLDDPINLYDEWLRIVSSQKVSGKESHDARLVAFMGLHGIQHLLTYNVTDFSRYTYISLVDPATVTV
jgi:predicted nucleic acid-binding protein